MSKYNIFRVNYSYETTRGNRKSFNKDILLKAEKGNMHLSAINAFWDWVKCFNETYPYRRIKNVCIEAIEFYATTESKEKLSFVNLKKLSYMDPEYPEDITKGVREHFRHIHPSQIIYGFA